MIKNLNIFIILIKFRSILILKSTFQQGQFLINLSLIHVETSRSSGALTHVSLGNFHVGVVYHLRNPFNLPRHLLRIIHNSRRLLNAYKVIFSRRIGHVLDLAVRVQ